MSVMEALAEVRVGHRTVRVLGSSEDGAHAYLVRVDAWPYRHVGVVTGLTSDEARVHLDMPDADEYVRREITRLVLEKLRQTGVWTS